MLGRKIVSHSSEETAWAKEKIESGVYTMASFRRDGTIEELEQRFGRKLTVNGLYSWFRYLKNPELKQKEQENYRANKRERKSTPSVNSNAKFLREQETFEKSNILAYVNHNIVGFETDNDLKDFMIKNQVMGEHVFVFKRIPIKIEYSVQLG
jgi:hypothetical protein